MILKLALVCAATVIVNHTDVWDEQDKAVLKQASTRCGEIFPDAPCLKKIVKLEDNSYQIYCGAPDESKD
jgi:hypothetical protein